MSFASCSISPSSKGSANKCSGGSKNSSSQIKGLIKGLVGDENADRAGVLNTLVGSKVQVASIGIYGTPLNENGKLSHNFVLIDVNHATRGRTIYKGVSLIKAEKVTENGRGKIVLSVLKEFDGEGEKDIVQLNGCGKIPGEKLLEILEKYHTPAYSLLKFNCWKYADAVHRRLIVEFANLPDTDSENKKRLRKYLKDLPAFTSPSDALKWGLKALQTIIPIVWQTGFAWFSLPLLFEMGTASLVFTGLFTAGAVVPLFLYVGALVYCGWRLFSGIYVALKPGLKKGFTLWQWVRIWFYDWCEKFMVRLRTPMLISVS